MQGLTDPEEGINFKDPLHLWTAFLTIAIMGFTYSIFNGICFGFIAYAFIKLIRAAADYFAEKHAHLQVVFSAAATALAFSGALATFYVVNNSITVTLFSAGASSQVSAGMALMLIGAIVSVGSLAYAARSALTGVVASKNIYLALTTLALVCVFIGTILPCNVDGSSCRNIRDLTSNSGIGFLYGAAWGCSIASNVVLAFSLLHTLVGFESMAKYLKPEAGTDVSLPHPVMYVDRTIPRPPQHRTPRPLPDLTPNPSGSCSASSSSSASATWARKAVAVRARIAQQRDLSRRGAA